MIHKVLLIDDLKAIYSTVHKILSERGCQITYCSTGLEGLKKAEEETFDLILLDIHLPDCNGLEVCKKLKQLPEYQLRPVLLLTSDMKKLERGLMVGASDYIIKPFKEVELIARVFTQLNLSKNQIAAQDEVKDLKKNIHSQHNKLEELQSDLHQYFYQTAHKLRSPLSSMEGLFSLMKMENPEVASNQYVALIERTVNNLSYVNQQIAKIGELKTHDLNINSFNLSKSLDRLIHNKFESASIDIKVDENIIIQTDHLTFINGLTPVIENAVYYSDLFKKDKSHITIKGTESDANYHLTIEDNGPGICQDKLQKIFDMFYIGNEQSLGNGLGLFISKTALDKLNIDLKIVSKEKEYTRAILSIPKDNMIEKQILSESQKTA